MMKKKIGLAILILCAIVGAGWFLNRPAPVKLYDVDAIIVSFDILPDTEQYVLEDVRSINRICGYLEKDQWEETREWIFGASAIESLEIHQGEDRYRIDILQAENDRLGLDVSFYRGGTLESQKRYLAQTLKYGAFIFLLKKIT